MEQRKEWAPVPGRPPRDLYLKPFGVREEDLDIDFDLGPRPDVVTRILHCCCRDEEGRRVDEGFVNALTVGKRIECLLKIAALGGLEEASTPFACTGERCGEALEVSISWRELADVQHEREKIHPISARVDGETLRFRRPTANDQLAWLKQAFPDEPSATRAMIRDLRIEGEAPGPDSEPALDPWVEAVDDAMREFDPLVDFRLTVVCPGCGGRSEHALDLEEIALRELRGARRRLLTTIHRLASRYHWTERRILSIPPWRRARYLALIEKDERA